MLKKLKGKQVPDPSEYEDDEEDDFISDCVDEIGNEDVCQMLWEDRSVEGVKYKIHASKVEGMEFILSDETPDRMDDVILAEGWDLKQFKRNPIALFGHMSSFPIGKWANVRVENKQLRGHLELAPEGTSQRIDEIRRLIDADILRAVSVGFRSIERKDRDGTDWGSVFVKCELVETSVVAVPANPNALAVAKSMNISPETIKMVFAGQGKGDRIRRRGFNGGHAKTHRTERVRPMSSLAQRIVTLEEQITSKRDALQDHTEKMDDTNVSNSDLEIIQKFNQDIAQLVKVREALIDTEKSMAREVSQQDPPTPRHKALVVPGERPAAPAIIHGRTKEFDPIDMFVKAGTLAYFAKGWGQNLEDARAKIASRYPEYKDDAVKLIADIVLRSATAPAMTTVAGWAQELVQTTFAPLMPLLMPKSILARLGPKGLVLSFGATGKIVIPTRSRTPSLAGSFVGEGLAIPVRQGAFTSQTLTPKKMAVITTWTKEMDEHSIPAIEGLLREAIQQDTSVAVDSVLIDANPATMIRPAGLLNTVAATVATAGGGIPALVGDITGLISAISTATYGNVRNLVWLANQTDMLRASMLTAVNTGIFPFKAEIAGGTLNNIPIIDSATVPAKTLVLVDAADFVVVGGDAPRMEMSDQATLHMEDTNPQDLVSAGSPGTVASPQRSLFQTDSLALRMILPLNWTQRRAGTVAWTQNVTW